MSQQFGSFDREARPSRVQLGALRVHIAVLIGYSLVTVAFTWPMVTTITEKVIGFGDVWQNMWSLWWVKTALLDLHTNPYYTQYLFYPTGVSLYYHALAPVNGILSTPFQWLGGLTFAYNALVLMGYILGGYGTYLLARRYAGSGPAFVAGLVFVFSPQHAVQTFGHLEQITHFWLPFYALGFLIAIEDRRWQRGLVAACLLVLASLVTWYYAFSLIVFSILVVGHQVWQSRIRGEAVGPVLRVALWIGAAYVLLIAPVLVPTLLEGRRATYMVHPIQATVQFSADLWAFVTPSALHPWWGERMMAIQSRFTGTIAENVVFLGFVPLLLAGVATVTRRQTAGRWILVAVVFAVLALGPLLHVNGPVALIRNRPVILPYALLYEWVPFVRVIRTPSRVSQMIMLAMGVLAALGLDELLARLRHSDRGVAEPCIRLRGWLPQAGISALAGMLILFEFWPIPFSFSTPPAGLPIAPNAAREGQRGAVLDVPPTHDGLRMYYQTLHRRPIVGGYLSRQPQEPLGGVLPLRQLMHLDPADQTGIVEMDAPPLQAAATLGFRYVVLHRDWFPPDQAATLPARVQTIFGDAAPTYQDENVTVYALTPPTSPTAVAYLSTADGWYDTETDGDAVFRWMASPAAIRVVASAPVTVRLALTPHWILRPSTLEVHTAEGRIGIYKITPGVTIITSPFSLRPGENLVRLVVPEGNVSPAEVYAGSRDVRQVAVAFRRIQVRPELP